MKDATYEIESSQEEDEAGESAEYKHHEDGEQQRRTQRKVDLHTQRIFFSKIV